MHNLRKQRMHIALKSSLCTWAVLILEGADLPLIRGELCGLVGLFADKKKGKIRRTCTEFWESDSCSTIGMLPGIDLGEDTVCHCSTNLCNTAPTVTAIAKLCVITCFAFIVEILQNVHLLWLKFTGKTVIRLTDYVWDQTVMRIWLGFEIWLHDAISILTADEYGYRLLM